MRTTVKRRAPRVARKSKRLLIVGKLTPYEAALEKNDEHVLGLIAADHPSVVHMIPEHEEHHRSLSRVLRLMRKHDVTTIRVDELGRKNLDRSKYDQILTLGGDGVVLTASHHVRDSALLGVKSASRSHAHFCLATPETLPEFLDDIFAGKRQPISLMRLNAFIDGKRVGPAVLNEVFLESRESTSYILQVGDKQEEQLSDGIFFATAAGSTAWMRAYGSKIVPITDRGVQYLVRGPILNSTHPADLLHGFSLNGEELSIITKNSSAIVAVDGRRNSFRMRRGSKLVVRPSEHDLRIYADPNCNDHYVAEQEARFRCAS
jgi:NAD+ kinase